MKLPKIKPLGTRSPLVVGVMGTAIVTCVVIAAFQYDKLPFIKDTNDYSAYFSEAGGIKTGSTVRVSGMGVGRVSDIRLEGTKVRVGFTVRKGIELGDRTEAAIKTETVLGSKMLELTSRGEGKLSGTIPLQRTRSPYDLPDALGDLTTTISGLDTAQLSSALATLADTFKETPADLKPALQGVARFSDTLNHRDAQLRSLLGNANKVSGVLGRRSQQIATLVADSNALLAALLDERDSLDALMNNLTAVSHQISGLVNDNRSQLKPALDKLNGVLEILDNRKQDLQATLPKFKRYAMSFGECLGSGPFFKAYVANLIPGQISGPTIDARMYDRFLDPNQGLPSESVDPPTGTPPVPPENGPHPIWSQPPSPGPAPGPPARASIRGNGRPVISRRTLRALTGISLAATLVVASVLVGPKLFSKAQMNSYTAYFAESNGLFVGDEVRILGVAVGVVDKIEPQPAGAKVTFFVDKQYAVPADARAAILSPSLVTSRAIQLVPAYSGGPKLSPGASIPLSRTAVPVEWDDFRRQLEKLTDALQPAAPGGVNSVGEFINSAADNLRGEGDTARDTVLKLSEAISALGDHADDIFSTVRNLQLLVSALHSSSDLLASFNENLAGVTTVLSNTPNEVANAVKGLDGALTDLRDFLAENRESIGVTFDRLGSITTALNDSRGDIKQILHIAPTVFQNFLNIYQPAQSAMTGIMALNNFADIPQWICSSIEAASRARLDRVSKLCLQYVNPIIKNRIYNYLPFGLNPFVGTQARPNEITYSEDRLRPGYTPPEAPPPDVAPPQPPAPAEAPPAPHGTVDSTQVLRDLMLPTGTS